LDFTGVAAAGHFFSTVEWIVLDYRGAAAIGHLFAPTAEWIALGIIVVAATGYFSVATVEWIVLDPIIIVGASDCMHGRCLPWFRGRVHGVRAEAQPLPAAAAAVGVSTVEWIVLDFIIVAATGYRLLSTVEWIALDVITAAVTDFFSIAEWILLDRHGVAATGYRRLPTIEWIVLDLRGVAAIGHCFASTAEWISLDSIIAAATGPVPDRFTTVEWIVLDLLAAADSLRAASQQGGERLPRQNGLLHIEECRLHGEVLHQRQARSSASSRWDAPFSCTWTSQSSGHSS
jgi:hypothetical protein